MDRRVPAAAVLVAAAASLAALAWMETSGCWSFVHDVDEDRTRCDEGFGSGTPQAWPVLVAAPLAAAVSVLLQRRLLALTAAAAGLLEAIVLLGAAGPTLPGAVLVFAATLWWAAQEATVRTRDIAMASSLGLAALAVLNGALQSVDLFDPCHSWGHGSTVHLEPSDECPSVSSSSFTRGEEAARIAIVAAALLAPSLVTAFGARDGRRWACVLGAILFALVAALAFAGFAVTLALAALLCGSAAAAAAAHADARRGSPSPPDPAGS